MSRTYTNVPDGNLLVSDSFSERTSKNLSAAKGVAVLTVMSGHYASIPNFWVVVTVSLLIFTISSGYFTWQRYHGEFSLRSYWRRKAVRLGSRLIIIELFLFCLFLVEGRDGLWSWHTAVNLAGLNGFLNWFHIPNCSPYGAGMWFLTLLLIFYAGYPFLEQFYRRNSSSLAVTICGTLCLFVLNHTMVYGHALWLTAAGFFVGIFLAQCHLRLSLIAAVGMVIMSAVGMIVSHTLFAFDKVNFFFILSVAVGVNFCLMEVDLPQQVTCVGRWLSGILLEIYLLHPYLMVKPTGINMWDVSISIAVVLFVGALLGWIGKQVRLYISGYLI
jgi:hypothetical protein